MAQIVGIDLPSLLKQARDTKSDTVKIPATLPGGVQIEVVVYIFGRQREAPAQGLGDLNVICN